MHKKEATLLLRNVLNNFSVEFREGQWEVIDTVANKNKKLLLVQRTGWEKALFIFYPQKYSEIMGGE